MDGSDGRDVGQVRASTEWVVQNDHVVGGEGAQLLQRGLHAHGHRSQVDRHVITDGHGHAARIEEGARIVAPFLDVRGERGSSQGRSHLLGERREQVPEDLERDRVRGVRDGLRGGPGGSPGSHGLGLFDRFAASRGSVIFQGLNIIMRSGVVATTSM